MTILTKNKPESAEIFYILVGSDSQNNIEQSAKLGKLTEMEEVDLDLIYSRLAY